MDKDASLPQSSSDTLAEAQCDLIYSLLHALLLSMHSYLKKSHLANISSRPADVVDYPAPRILQPIVDLLQYQVFCERVHVEMNYVVDALRKVGVPTLFQFDPVGENGEALVRALSEQGSCHVGGQALLRIDNRQVIATLIMKS